MSQPRLAEKLRQNLGQCLRCEADDHSRLFLSKEDLENFWETGREDIEVLLGQKFATDEERSGFKREFSRITCVLLWIKFREASYPDLFDKLVVSAGTERGLRDSNLPVSLDLCEEIFGKFYAPNFHDEQYNFLEPIYIDPSQFERYYRWHRFPYVGKPKVIGTGAFGQVSKVNILRNYCRTNGDSNDEVRFSTVLSGKSID